MGILICIIILVAVYFYDKKSQPVDGTQEYLDKKYGNTPNGLYMKACVKTWMYSYKDVPATQEEIDAYNNAPCNKKNGETYPGNYFKHLEEENKKWQ